MRSFLPTLRQLSYLVALGDQRHFGRAAQALGVSQSTLSSGLTELEKLLGAGLVERSRRAVHFTALGEAVLARARRLLHDAEELAALVESRSAPMTGELRMAVIPTIAPFLLPRLLNDLKRRYPELALFLREEASAAACDALHRAAVDCVLLALPFPCGGGDIATAPLFDDPLLLALPADHKLAERTSIAPSALDGEPLLMLEDGHCLKDHALAACGPGTGEAAMLGTSLHTLMQMVAGGLGITFVPQMAVRAGLAEDPAVAVRPIATASGQEARRTIALVWRRASPRAGDFRLLGEAIAAIGRS